MDKEVKPDNNALLVLPPTKPVKKEQPGFAPYDFGFFRVL